MSTNRLCQFLVLNSHSVVEMQIFSVSCNHPRIFKHRVLRCHQLFCVIFLVLDSHGVVEIHICSASCKANEK